MGTESPPWFGAGPHQAEHNHRHQTAAFRSRETCPEAGSKRALTSDKLGPSPKNRLPLWKWQVRWMTAASQEPPPLTTLGPLGKGGALCNRRSTAVPVGPPRPSSITHPEVAPATVTCSYIEAGAGLGLGRTTRRRSAPLFEMMGRVGFDSRIFPPWMAGHPCLTQRASSFQGEPANIGNG